MKYRSAVNARIMISDSYGELTLVPFTRHHIGKTFTWVADAEFRQLFLMRGEVTWPAHQEYFRKVLADPTQHWYAILWNGEHIGNSGLKNTTQHGRDTCTIWIYLGDPSIRGKGIGSRATRKIIDMAFFDPEVRRIVIHVAKHNWKAIRMYQALGFLEIPLGDEDGEWRGRDVDVIKMYLTRGAP